MSRNPSVCLLRTMIEDAGAQVISAARPEWIFPFTGLQPAQFRRLVRLVAERGADAIADGRPGRQWALDLADRVLLSETDLVAKTCLPMAPRPYPPVSAMDTLPVSPRSAPRPLLRSPHCVLDLSFFFNLGARVPR